VAEFADEVASILRTVMFCLGTQRIDDLKGSPALQGEPQ
jgi:isopentenyl diphosphate isomerase/L-lactate dehydrogenase-like FMN-dependent dehydrogenase